MTTGRYSNESELLKTTEFEKDLGVNMNRRLKFFKHIEIQVNKANKMKRLIRRSHKYLDSGLLKDLVIGLVRPYLVMFFGPRNSLRIESS